MRTSLLDSYLYHNHYLEEKVTAISMTITDKCHSQNKPKNTKKSKLAQNDLNLGLSIITIPACVSELP